MDGRSAGGDGYAWASALLLALAFTSLAANAGVIALAARLKEPRRELHLIVTAAAASALSLVAVGYQSAAVAFGQSAVLGDPGERSVACTAQSFSYLYSGATYVGCLVLQVRRRAGNRA